MKYAIEYDGEYLTDEDDELLIFNTKGLAQQFMLTHYRLSQPKKIKNRFVHFYYDRPFKYIPII